MGLWLLSLGICRVGGGCVDVDEFVLWALWWRMRWGC